MQPFLQTLPVMPPNVGQKLPVQRFGNRLRATRKEGSLLTTGDT
jgi:hypothetical protein